jgi:hypothetical protein
VSASTPGFWSRHAEAATSSYKSSCANSPPWSVNSASSDFEACHYALLGLMCIYAIELLPDNIVECRANLLDIFSEYLALSPSDDLYKAAFYVLTPHAQKEIIQQCAHPQ